MALETQIFRFLSLMMGILAGELLTYRTFGKPKHLVASPKVTTDDQAAKIVNGSFKKKFNIMLERLDKKLKPAYKDHDTERSAIVGKLGNDGFII